MTSNLDAIFDQLDEAMEAATADVPSFTFDEVGDSITGVVADLGRGTSDYGTFHTITIRKRDGELARVAALGTVFAREVEDALARGMTLGWAIKITRGADGKSANGAYKVFKVKAMPTGEAPAPAPATNGVTEAPAATQEPLDSDRPF